MRNKYKVALTTALMMALILSGCSKSEPAIQVTPETPVVDLNQITLGDSFMKAPLKVKSRITDTNPDSPSTYVVELFVDGGGDGEGLIKTGDTVLNLKVYKDTLYVTLPDDTVCGIHDVTGHLIPSDLELSGVQDLSLKGFNVVDGNPIGFGTIDKQLLIDTQFAQSEELFETVPIAAEKFVSITELNQVIADSVKNSIVGVVNELVLNGAQESVYLDSYYGVKIGDKIYSLGDTVNKSTYFRGLVPEGILQDYEYREDVRVDSVYTSYNSVYGRTVFTCVEDKVTAILTSGIFEFLGIHEGMPKADLRKALGLGLTRTEMENFKPIDDGLAVIDANDKAISCQLENMGIEFRMEKGVLTSIYISEVGVGL